MTTATVDLDRSAVGTAFTREARRRPDAVALRWLAEGGPATMTYGPVAGARPRRRGDAGRPP